VWDYAVMSSHLHIDVEVIPQVADTWSADEVAARWLRLYRRRDVDADSRAEVVAGDPERVDVLRARLSNLSWFMRCLAEPIARRANREDRCKGHFMSMDGRYAGFAGAKKPAWEARFKSQTLLDETAVLSAMRYVDLNPVRAGISDSLEDSAHTSARLRLESIEHNCEKADAPLAPILGLRGFGVLSIRRRDYLDLVDHTGRQVHPGKRGVITGPPPLALSQMKLNADAWKRQVRAVGNGYFRAIGDAETLVEKARAIEQHWLRGVGVARFLSRAMH
jgi:REP element-mobilizing transposase RayT